MKFNRERLAELQASNLPRMTAKDIVEIKEPSPEADAQFDLIDGYVKGFVKTDGTCVCCGAQQGGDVMAALLGTARFKWGIAHGEGFCSACGYPGRAMHYIGEGKSQIRLSNCILQYHPDELSFASKEESVEA